MESNEIYDFLNNYKQVSQRIKKRFLKKPNIAEASHDFGQLAKTLSAQDCPHYAAFCKLAQARTEHMQTCLVSEAEHLVEAAFLFLKSHGDDLKMACINVQEHLLAALNCIHHALRIYEELNEPALAAKTALKVAELLKDMKDYSNAINYFFLSFDLQPDPFFQVISLQNTASCHLKIQDYSEALSIYLATLELISSILGQEQPRGIYSEIFGVCEINALLLLLLLQFPTSQLSKQQKTILSKYSMDLNNPNESDDEVNEKNDVSCPYLNPYLFSLLQTLTLSSLEKNAENCAELMTDLYPLLDPEQYELVFLITDLLHGETHSGMTNFQTV